MWVRTSLGAFDACRAGQSCGLPHLIWTTGPDGKAGRNQDHNRESDDVDAHQRLPEGPINGYLLSRTTQVAAQRAADVYSGVLSKGHVNSLQVLHPRERASMTSRFRYLSIMSSGR